MDEATVREHARLHAEAVQRGDLRTAAEDLTASAGASAPSVMAALPDPISAVEVPRVTDSEDGWVVHIAYRGAGDPVVVESLWAEIEGRPKMTRLRVLPAG